MIQTDSKKSELHPPPPLVHFGISWGSDDTDTKDGSSYRTEPYKGCSYTDGWCHRDYTRVFWSMGWCCTTRMMMMHHSALFRERANLQLANRRLERKVKEMMMQGEEEHHSMQDQKDQVCHHALVYRLAIKPKTWCLWLSESLVFVEPCITPVRVHPPYSWICV